MKYLLEMVSHCKYHLEANALCLTMSTHHLSQLSNQAAQILSTKGKRYC